jgi:hypothetical protein
MKKTLLNFLGVAMLAVGSAQSAVVVDSVVLGNLGQTENAALDPLNTQVLLSDRWFAVGFNLASNPGQWYGLQNVKIGLIGSANVTLTLYSDSGGLDSTPLAPLAQTDTKTVASGSPVLTTFNLSQGGLVTPSGNFTNISPGNYWFVASSSGFINWVNTASGTTPVEFSPVNVNVGPASPSGWTYVATKFTTNSGSTWSSAIVGPAQNLSISVAAIPEPGTWAAMAILAGGAAFAGWRRRRQQTVA